MQYTLKKEIDSFDGNAQRNCRKLVNSGIIQRIINYCRRSTSKALEISIPFGDPNDAYVLLTSIAAQQWRKRVAKENTLPKGFTRSPKLGAGNYAFSKGLASTEPTNLIHPGKNSVIIERTGAELIVETVIEYRDQFPELGGLL